MNARLRRVESGTLLIAMRSRFYKHLIVEEFLVALCRLYDNRLPIEPRYPATRPSVADIYVWEDGVANGQSQEKGEHEKDIGSSDNERIEEERLRHAPPGLVF